VGDVPTIKEVGDDTTTERCEECGCVIASYPTPKVCEPINLPPVQLIAAYINHKLEDAMNFKNDAKDNDDFIEANNYDIK
jgi:hypothetical protein